MRTISVAISCNGCADPYPETIEASSEQWELDLPVRIGDNPIRSLDLCPRCSYGLLELVNSGEIVKKPHRKPTAAPEKPKRKQQVRETSGDYHCVEPGCDRSFSTAQGLNMHWVRLHKNAAAA